MNATAASPVLSAALAYHRAGLSVHPLRLDGTKAPATASWKPFQQRQATEDEIRQWFERGRHGIGIVCGAVSGNLRVLDFDVRALLDDFFTLADAYGYGDLARSLPLVETPEGAHLYVRVDERVGGNTVYARDAKGKATGEDRAEGGYVVGVGSPASVHPTGRTYRLVSGSLECIPVLPASEMEALLDLIRMLNEAPEDDLVREVPKKTERAEGSGLRPGDDFNARGDLLPILLADGWRVVRSRGIDTFLARPDQGRRGWAAKLGTYGGRTLFTVFSSTAAVGGLAPNPGQRVSSHEPFKVYAEIAHKGDYQAAARALAEMGFGDPYERPSAPEAIADLLDDPEPAEASTYQSAPAGMPPSPEDAGIGSVARRLRDFADVRPMGLVIRKDISIEDHDELGRRLIGLDAGLKTWLNFSKGDWYIALPDTRGTRNDQVQARYGKGVLQQVKNAGSVCRVWPMDARRTEIRSWNFYRETSRRCFSDSERQEYADRFIQADRDHRGTLVDEIIAEAKRRNIVEMEAHAPAPDLEMSMAPDPMGDIARHGRAEISALLDELVRQRGEREVRALLQSLLSDVAPQSPEAHSQPAAPVLIDPEPCTLTESPLVVPMAETARPETSQHEHSSVDAEYPRLSSALAAGDLDGIDEPFPADCGVVRNCLADVVRSRLSTLQRMGRSASPMAIESVLRAKSDLDRLDEWWRKRPGSSPGAEMLVNAREEARIW